MSGKPVRISGECLEAIRDIQREIAKSGLAISDCQASTILGKTYFRLKNVKKPSVIWEFKPGL